MAPAFSKEAILQGSIDHLCLACESYLRSERDVCLHVSTADHRRNVDSTDYVHKYRDDRIRKVKTGYFCEFCNVPISTRTAVRLHAEELTHKENKSSPTIVRDGDIILFGNKAISEEAWNGFIDDNTCTICNVEYEDQKVHKTEPTHIINLIRSKVNIEKNIYRTIDNTFHCLTCNEVIADITTHLDEVKHKTLFQNCIKRTPIKDDKTWHTDNEPNTAMGTSHSVKANIKNKVQENESKTSRNLNTDKKNNKEDQNIATKPVFQNQETKNSEHVEARGIQKAKQSQSTLRNLGRDIEKHNLKYDRINNKIHCQICNKSIPPFNSDITEHVNGEMHKRKLNSFKTEKSNDKNCNFPRVPTIILMNSLGLVDILNREDMVINEKYCIDYNCFHFFTNVNKVYVRCQVCEVNMPKGDKYQHVWLNKHVRALRYTPVVILNETEFIREIRSEIFQCGYCNIIDTWEGMRQHLKSTDHERNKREANNRLVIYRMHILEMENFM